MIVSNLSMSEINISSISCSRRFAQIYIEQRPLLPRLYVSGQRPFKFQDGGHGGCILYYISFCVFQALLGLRLFCFL